MSAFRKVIEITGNGLLLICFLLLTYGIAGLAGAGLGMVLTGENELHNLVPAAVAMVVFHWWLNSEK